jgi:hypothetical protein
MHALGDDPTMTAFEMNSEFRPEVDDMGCVNNQHLSQLS